MGEDFLHLSVSCSSSSAHEEKGSGLLFLPGLDLFQCSVPRGCGWIPEPSNEWFIGCALRARDTYWYSHCRSAGLCEGRADPIRPCGPGKDRSLNLQLFLSFSTDLALVHIELPTRATTAFERYFLAWTKTKDAARACAYDFAGRREGHTVRPYRPPGRTRGRETHTIQSFCTRRRIFPTLAERG